MTATTAAPGVPIFNRSRRRIAVWALALTLGGAAAGTATTLAVNHDDSSASKAVPAAVVVVSNPQSLPRTADSAEQWTNTGTPVSTPGSDADSSDAFHAKLGPGAH
jgi:hypothetical protein